MIFEIILQKMDSILCRKIFTCKTPNLVSHFLDLRSYDNLWYIWKLLTRLFAKILVTHVFMFQSMIGSTNFSQLWKFYFRKIQSSKTQSLLFFKLDSTNLLHWLVIWAFHEFLNFFYNTRDLNICWNALRSGFLVSQKTRPIAIIQNWPTNLFIRNKNISSKTDWTKIRNLKPL